MYDFESVCSLCVHMCVRVCVYTCMHASVLFFIIYNCLLYISIINEQIIVNWPAVVGVLFKGLHLWSAMNWKTYFSVYVFDFLFHTFERLFLCERMAFVPWVFVFEDIWKENYNLSSIIVKLFEGCTSFNIACNLIFESAHILKLFYCYIYTITDHHFYCLEFWENQSVFQLKEILAWNIISFSFSLINKVQALFAEIKPS